LGAFQAAAEFSPCPPPYGPTDALRSPFHLTHTHVLGAIWRDPLTDSRRIISAVSPNYSPATSKRGTNDRFHPDSGRRRDAVAHACTPVGGGDWTTGTMDPRDTTEPIEVRPYDLLIICHTVSDDRARGVIAWAAAISPNVKVLAISRPGNDRKVDSANHVIETVDPAIFIQAVKTLLN
jgi:hypothetical protein